jgi:hypothetical protein
LFTANKFLETIFTNEINLIEEQVVEIFEIDTKRLNTIISYESANTLENKTLDDFFLKQIINDLSLISGGVLYHSNKIEFTNINI